MAGRSGPKALSVSEPIERGLEAEHAHERASGLLGAGGDGAPLLQPGPEALDLVAMDVDPVWAGECFLVAPRRIAGWAPRSRMWLRKALAWGRHASTRGSSTVHCASVDIPPRSPKQGKRRDGPMVQRLTGPSLSLTRDTMPLTTAGAQVQQDKARARKEWLLGSPGLLPAFVVSSWRERTPSTSRVAGSFQAAQ